MLAAAFAGLALVVQWPAIGYLALGVVIGLYFGAMPGLSGLVGLAILLPFTFDMDSISAFALLLGMFAVTTTSDTIASVLLGIPGTVASQATVLDGYPMAMRGEAARAFGAAFMVSALGGVIGALFLGLSIPIVRPLILSFASPEFFLLGVLGLTMVGSLSGDSILKGMVAAVFGLILSMVGYAEMGAIARYHFGLTYLLDGVPLIPLVLGLFALPELLELAVRGDSISKVPRDQVKGGMIQGIKDAIKHKWLVIRCSAIGIYVGMLPGLGGAIVDWIAYGHAVQSAKDRTQFGKGDVRGVIAPESANNAMKGGALIPTVAFGIPGSAPMALILGALTIQGLTPGPQMLTTELNVTFSLVWTLVIANILGAALLMLGAGQIARITFIPGKLIIPAVVLFVFMGAWMNSNALGDWITLLVFGILGYLMKQSDVPRPPVILGFILGPIMENALFITNQAYGPVSWVLRPICLTLVCLVAATIAYSVFLRRRNRTHDKFLISNTQPSRDSLMSLGMVTAMAIVFIYTTLRAIQWPVDAAMFPLAIGSSGILLASLSLYQDARSVNRMRKLGDPTDRWKSLKQKFAEFPDVASFYIWLLGLLGASIIIGQRIAFPLFILVYLRVSAKSSWILALTYAATGWVFLELMFDWVVHVTWYPAALLN